MRIIKMIKIRLSVVLKVIHMIKIKHIIQLI